MTKKPKQGSSKEDILIILLLVIIILVPRIIGLDRFITVDEPSWVGYGANTYYAIGQRDISAIVTKYSPGITTIWFGIASIHLLLPEYRGLGQGYLWNDDMGVANIMAENGRPPIDILVGSRVFSILAITAALILVFIYSRRLLGVFPAISSVVLISLEPYYLGHSRLLTHEGLISSLLILSILSFITYLYQGRRNIDLVLSASAGAFACLTKSTSTIIIPFVVLMGIVALFEFRLKKKHGHEGKENQSQFRYILLPLLIWLVVFMAVYVALWPPMWITPLQTLKHIYGSAFGMAFGGVKTNGEVAGKSLQSFLNLQGFISYFRVLLTRTTPIIWLGFLIGLGSKLFNKKTLNVDPGKRVVLYLLVFGGMFYCMMALAASKYAPHYVMTTMVCLMFVAGIGLVLAIQWLKETNALRKLGVPVFLGTLILFQTYNLVSYYPYYYPYTNPIVAAISSSQGAYGYGEGLELAAEYLSQKPKAENLTVMSWFAGIPGYLFPGEIFHIKPRPQWDESSAQKLRKSDYLVIYYDVQLRLNLPEKLMHDLTNVIPEHSISMLGSEYIRIYKVSELPDSVYIHDSP